MRATYLALAVAMAVASTPAEAQTYRIEWELAYPFRLFAPYSAPDTEKFFAPEFSAAMAKSWKPRRDLYVWEACKADDRPILCSENYVGAGRITRQRSLMKPKLLDAEGNGAIWEALLKEGTRYNSRLEPFGPDPKSRAFDQLVRLPGDSAKHPVLLTLTLEGKPLPTEAVCLWAVDGAEQAGSCTEFAAEFTRTADPAAQGSTVSVKVQDLPDANVPALASDETRVRERLILGIGDSFASGDGNPDIPFWHGKKTSKLTSDKWPERSVVGSAEASIDGAQWFDRRCHRSLLSSQTRAVVQLAALYPKEEFTLLPLACSGAEVGEGLLGRYEGVEAVGDRNSPQSISQFNQAMLELCAEFTDADYKMRLAEPAKAADYLLTCKALKRPVDAILLSIGGNDIGFSRLVEYAFMSGINSGDGSTLANLYPFREKYSPAAARAKLGNLKTSLERLAATLKSSFEATPTIVTSYPTLMTKSSYNSRQVCGVGNGLPGGLASGLERIPTNQPLQYDIAVVRQLEDVAKSLNETLAGVGAGWHMVTAHEAMFRGGHGLCTPGCVAHEPTGAAPWMLPNCTTYPGASANMFFEGLLDPRRALADPASGRKGLTTFESYNAFARTQRYVRTANDVAVIVNQQLPQRVARKSCQDMLGSISAGFLTASCAELLKELEALRGGAAHPNSYGAAVLADSYLAELKKVLELK